MVLEHSDHKKPNEQWIIYAEKTVSNFSSNAKKKIILCGMLKIVYTENNEQFLWENSEQFYLIQKTNFMNAIRIYSKHDV